MKHRWCLWIVPHSEYASRSFCKRSIQNRDWFLLPIFSATIKNKWHDCVIARAMIDLGNQLNKIGWNVHPSWRLHNGVSCLVEKNQILETSHKNHNEILVWWEGFCAEDHNWEPVQINWKIMILTCLPLLWLLQDRKKIEILLNFSLHDSPELREYSI